MKIDFYKNKNILVTGGAGFIGSHLVEKLTQLNTNITILDNLSSGNLDNLKNVFNKINFIKGDICNFNTCLNATNNCDIIFHLAALVSVPESTLDPIKCNEINVNGTLNLLQAARLNKIQKFIFSSSSAVYGNQNKTISETTKCNPKSPYGLSKLIGEYYCRLFAKEVPAICLRYFNVFGSKQNPNGEYAGVVAKFTQQIQENKPITIFGDGKQTRDFIEVEKIVETNIKLATLNRAKLNGQPVNVASGKSISILQLTELLKTKYPNYNNKIIFKPKRNGDILNSYTKIDKLMKLLQDI
jgi:nucleoside-diphosphate-sugar epimerase